MENWYVCLDCGLVTTNECISIVPGMCLHKRNVFIGSQETADAIGERIRQLVCDVVKLGNRMQALGDAERAVRSERDQYRAASIVAEMKLDCLPPRERARLLR